MTTSMALVGDIYMKRDDPASLFSLTGTHLTGSDIVFGNLEAPLIEKGTPVIGKTAFKSEPRMVEALTAGRFKAVGVANNHSMDQGAEGILNTLKVLDRAKIAHTGAGRNVVEAHKPAIVEAKGTKVAFLSYASVFLPTYAAEADRPGIAKVTVATAYQAPARVFEQPASPPIIITTPDAADMEALRHDIKKAKRRADIVVISWHWGVSQGFRALVPYQVDLGHAAIDAGADLIIGHHPHVLQGIEVYKGKVICYSMGNFVFTYKSPYFDIEAIILKCQIDGKHIKRVSFVPALANDDLQPVVLGPKEGQAVVDKIKQLSTEFGTTFKPEGNEIVIGPKAS
ncbi:MAG: CapA family protein [Chloroflexota bacterium]